MVVFQGCSFTWGQNLHFYEWHKQRNIQFSNEFYYWPWDEKGKQPEGVQEDRPLIFDWDKHGGYIDAQSEKVWLKLRASSVLSDRLGKEWACVNNSGNGGSNGNSINEIRTFKESIDQNIEMWNPYWKIPEKWVVVLQLTHAGRDYKGKGDFSNNKNSPTWKEESIHVLKTVEKVDELYEELKEQNIHLITWSWPGDLGWLTKDKPYSCGIRIDDDVFDSFDEAQLYSSVPESNYYFVNEFLDKPIHSNEFRKSKSFKPKHDVPITIRQSLGVGDDHPSKEFHEVIADSIYQKMKELDLL